MFVWCSLQSLIFMELLALGLTAGHITVTSPAGTFLGSVMTAPNGQEFGAYRGIPFGLPPVGELRFAKPLPAPPLQETYDATMPGPICVQAKVEFQPDVDIGQEDCLYINVFVPLSKNEFQEQGVEKKKAFVFMHGGGWVVGSANDWIPGDFVTQTDIIVVTFNYRLSWLGFLQGNTTQLPGNLAFWDQIMALQWVKDNIRAFGGDPDDVTIGGESAGGESSSLFVLSPFASHLFTKAIMMSGSLFTLPTQPGDYDRLLDDLVNHVGCGAGVSPLTTAEEATIGRVLACLRALPAERFYVPMPEPVTVPLPRIDGDLIPAAFVELIADEAYLEKVGFYDKNILVSMTSNEGAIVYWGVFASQPEPAHDNFTFYEPAAEALGVSHAVFEKVVEAYKKSPDLTSQPILDILTDIIVTLPSIKTLETHSKSGKGNTYFMYFDHAPTYMPPPQKGVFHAMDLCYMFDMHPNSVLELYYGMKATGDFSEVDRQMKNSFIQHLADFIKTGHPDTPTTLSSPWLPYNTETEFYLKFNGQPKVDQRPLAHRRKIMEGIPQLIKDEELQQQQEEKQRQHKHVSIEL